MPEKKLNAQHLNNLVSLSFIIFMVYFMLSSDHRRSPLRTATKTHVKSQHEFTTFKTDPTLKHPNASTLKEEKHHFGDYNVPNYVAIPPSEAFEKCEMDFMKKNDHPRTALAGYPGSGTMWLRHLIQQATGYWTGSIKSSDKLVKLGWAGERLECDDPALLAIATPRYHTIQKCCFDQVAILIRNPIKVFIAEFNRKTAGKMKETQPGEFAMRGWNEFLAAQINEYEQFYTSWIRSKIPKTVICFESLEQEPVKGTLNLAAFMQVNMRQNCVEKNTEGCLHRQHDESFTYGHLFNQTIRAQLHQVVDNLSRLLRNRQFDDCTEAFDNSLLLD